MMKKNEECNPYEGLHKINAAYQAQPDGTLKQWYNAEDSDIELFARKKNTEPKDLPSLESLYNEIDSHSIYLKEDLEKS